VSTPEDRQRRPTQPDQPTSPQPGEPAGYYDPDGAPATVGDVRNLRRWMIVALVWAVAASAIALLALLDDDTGGGDDEGSSSSSAARVERRLETRIDELERRVERAPSGEDIEGMGNRVDEVEGQVEGLGDAPSEDSINQLGERIDELERRVEELENEPPPDEATP
jgi:tetrahydromethanopterin S-methyltransferase subunit G